MKLGIWLEMQSARTIASNGFHFIAYSIEKMDSYFSMKNIYSILIRFPRQYPNMFYGEFEKVIPELSSKTTQ